MKAVGIIERDCRKHLPPTFNTKVETLRPILDSSTGG
jgi:hypothetical protein